ncbi:MAG: c-type cytochrome [Thermoanaerobaculia bacterium]
MKIVRPALFAAALVVVAAGCDLSSRTPGERLWRARCAECHGLDATGNTPRYMSEEWADLTDDAWHELGGDDASLQTVIREGVFGRMPANPDLTPTQMRDLIEHLRRLRGEAAK